MNLVVAIVAFATLVNPPVGEHVGEFIEINCLECHQGSKPKGDLDLEPLASSAGLHAASPLLLKMVRDRLRARDMPPFELALSPEEVRALRPSEAEFRSASADLGGVIKAKSADQGFLPVVIRRLNRVEYANAVRELVGVEIDIDHLPSDDVGQTFDHLGEVLSMSPLLFEKAMNVAEYAARNAIHGNQRSDPAVYRAQGERLLGSKSGRRAIRGEVFAEFEVPSPGRYRAEFLLAGQQAGNEPVKYALCLDHKEQSHVVVPETIQNPATHSFEFQTADTFAQLGASFLNDYYNPKDKDRSNRDRNAVVAEIRLVGPLDPQPPTVFQKSLASRLTASGGKGRATAAKWLLEQAWRRRVESAEAFRVADLATEMVDKNATDVDLMRAMVVYALVSPEFLFRFERGIDDAEPSSDGTVPLVGTAIATRLASFLFASVPDEVLLKHARMGRLDDAAGVRRQVKRMLKDPRSRVFAERFLTQWLRIDGLEHIEPDPAIFGEIAQPLLSDMREESVRLFDAMVHEGTPIWALFDGSETFLSPRLAKHYGIEGIEGDGFRRVNLKDVAPDRAGLGVLAHASVLAVTSNATRTSPVKRGKWVLEAILDVPPAPPPPGTPQLPPAVENDPLSMRAMLEQHRKDPKCGICHVQMDAYGLALEAMDGVGRLRLGIDTETALPDGTHILGPHGLASMLRGNRDVLRSFARHMLVYALGRHLDWRDEPLLDDLVAHLVIDPSIGGLIEEIAVSSQFRRLPSPVDSLPVDGVDVP